VLSLAIAVVSWRFLLLDMRQAFPDMLAQIDQRRLIFTLHITASPMALAVGSLQFFAPIRRRRALHKWLGRLYTLAVLVGGVSGFAVALHAKGGFPSALGFGLLSVVWMAVTLRAVVYALRSETILHRRWMICSFALTFAGVTLRLYLGVGMFFGYDYSTLAPVLAWICWLPNLGLVEIWMRRKGY